MAAHNDLGQWGERTAQCYLLLHGYHILDLNWQVGHLEIDIVAEKLGFIIFVEVKTRNSAGFGSPLDAVDTKKMNNLFSASTAYLRWKHLNMPCQFDVISIIGNPDSYQLEHIHNAFDYISSNLLTAPHYHD